MSDTKQSRTYIRDNEAFVFFVSRAHKIASAIYLVTDLFDVREPLRWSLRSNVLDVVSSTASMLSSGAATPSSFVSVKHTIEEVLFMIETAGRSRLVSKMNRDVLFREIEAFVSELDSFVRDMGSNGTRTLESIFQSHTSVPQLPEQKLDDVYKGQFKGQQSYTNKQPRPASSPTRTTPSSQQTKDKQTQTSAAPDRRQRIISILKDKGAVTIKDIAAVIPDCSEKTIQRDLADMVSSGAVKKTGERRWTTYFL